MSSSFPILEAVKVRGAGATHEGPIRRRNEDAFSFVADSEGAVAVVAGSMGSHVAPHTAAHITAETCERIFRGRRSSILDELAETWWRAEHGLDEDRASGAPRPRPYTALPIADRVQIRDRVTLVLSQRVPDSMGDVAVLEAEARTLLELSRRSLERVNAELLRRAKRDPQRRAFMASAACVIFAAGHASIGHAGSCRVARVRDGAIEALTREHYLANEYDNLPERLREQITRQDVASMHPNIVVRSLGADEPVAIDTRVVPVERGDVFVLMTDGFWKTTPAEQIRDAILARGGDVEEVAGDLMARAKLERPDHPGDNLTVVVVSVV